MDQDWWKGAVVYQIYPRSFQDDSGDGIGDLHGITRRLDHVADLGADAVWLSPFFTSPMKDMGYDVSDYRDVDPLFGTLSDFEALLEKAHALDLKVIIDQVLSHSSDKHPCFVESRSSRDNPKADWYVWADARSDGTPPSNWLSVFGGSAWQWDTRRRQFYLHNFLKEQPDFNFHNPEVQDFHLDNLKFWLDLGVDGFRLDTVNYFFHDRRLTNHPALNDSQAIKPYDMQDHMHVKNQPENLPFLERMRALTDQYDAKTIVGEIGEAQRGLALMSEYTQGQRRLHMAYSFEMLGPEFAAEHFRTRIEGFFKAAPDGWPSWSFSNHDVQRHTTRWAAFTKDCEALAKQCIGLLAAFEGTIGLYQGEELGQIETELSFEELTDPPGIEYWPEEKGRDGCRTPMVWDAGEANGGFSDVQPWLPVKEPQLSRAVSEQTEEGSVLNHYKAVLAFRKASVLRTGSTKFVDMPEPLFAFERINEHDRLLCIFNLSAKSEQIDLAEGFRVDGPSQAATIKNGTLALGANGYAYLKQ